MTGYGVSRHSAAASERRKLVGSRHFRAENERTRQLSRHSRGVDHTIKTGRSFTGNSAFTIDRVIAMRLPQISIAVGHGREAA